MAGESKFSKADSDLWEAQLSSGLKYRAKFGREDRWRRYCLRLAHVFYDTSVGEASPVVNIMAARIRSLVPQLAIGMPVVKVESYTKPENENSEPALAKRLEMAWRAENMDSETRRVTLDAETFGIGIGFCGYETTWGERAIASQRKLLGVIPPDITESALSQAPFLAPLASSAETLARHLQTERVFLERTSPFDFVMDPVVSHITKCKWMARRIYLTRKEGEEWFGKKAPKAESVGNVSRSMSDGGTNPFGLKADSEIENAVDHLVRKIEVWELWDLESKKTVYLDSSGTVFAVREWASAYHTFPFSFMLWDELPDSPYPESLSAALEPQTNELNEIRKRELQEARKGIRKFVSNGPLSPKAKRGIQSDQDGEIIELSDYDNVTSLESAPIPSDFWMIENRIKDDMNEVSMTTPALAMSQGGVRKTATESAFIQSAADAMIGYRQLMVERFTEQVLEIMGSLITELFDEPIPIKLVNADSMLLDEMTGMPIAVGEIIEYQFQGTMHSGFYKYTVEPGSMVASAKDVERSHQIDAYKLFAPEAWFDKKKFATLILSSIPSVRNAGSYIIDETEMPQQQPAPQGAGMPGMPGDGGASAFGQVNASAEGDMLSALYGGMAPQGGM